MEDLVPNDGAMFDPSSVPAEQVKEESQFVNTATNPSLTLDALIERCNDRIKEADSLTGLGIDSSMPQLQVQIISEGNGKYIDKLREDIEWLNALKEAAKL